MKEKIQEIIAAYETAVSVIEPLCFSDAYDYLNSKDLEDGICFYVRMNHSEKEYFEIIKYLKLDNWAGYMFPSPLQCYTIESIIKYALMTRINYLKTFL